MSGLLADVFSFGNTAKRKIKGLLDDPMGSITQYINNENDRAGRFNQLTSEAAQEGAQAIKSGKSMVGPKSQQLAGLLADAYNPAGMVVWHGSPHRFTKFDSSKIGTGEGAQAYGHGLYVAESPDVALGYRDTLTKKRDPFVKVDESVFSSPQTHSLGNDAEGGAYALRDTLSNFAKAGKYPEKDFSGQEAFDIVSQAIAQKRSELSALKGSAKNQTLAELDALEKLIGINPSLVSASTVRDHGSLYKIDLPDEHIAKMLDWDKPLSQQPKEVQKAIKDYADLQGIENYVPKGQTAPVLLNQGISGDTLGQDIYRYFGKDAASPDAAGNLKAFGIPGIRYLDGGSRGTGQGTSNFVVFPGNEDLLKILEINGKPVNGLLSN